jgi:hypothetical protein
MKPLSAMISIVMEWGRLSYPNQVLVRIIEKCTRRLHGIEPFSTLDNMYINVPSTISCSVAKISLLL